LVNVAFSADVRSPDGWSRREADIQASENVVRMKVAHRAVIAGSSLACAGAMLGD
jgi:hypothetical protein